MSFSTVHPSIHYLYPLILGRVAGVLEPIPACIGREAGITPWTGRQSRL
uniref:Uncharacterized protein n=1 Tax=Anguilla anguilla TaxID=7936 RepID=A0A0E9SZL6_ANGAN